MVLVISAPRPAAEGTSQQPSAIVKLADGHRPPQPKAVDDRGNHPGGCRCGHAHEVFRAVQRAIPCTLNRASRQAQQIKKVRQQIQANCAKR